MTPEQELSDKIKQGAQYAQPLVHAMVLAALNQHRDKSILAGVALAMTQGAVALMTILPPDVRAVITDRFLEEMGKIDAPVQFNGPGGKA